MNSTTRYSFAWEDVTISMDVFAPSIAKQIGHFLAIDPRRSEIEDGCDIKIRRNQSGCFEADYEGNTSSFTRKEDLLISLLTFVSAMFLRETRHLVLHAGAILVDGEAVVFSGYPRVGKSRFAVKAWELGLRVIGDDWIVIDCAKNAILPFPKPLRPRMTMGELSHATQTRLEERDFLSGQFHNEQRLVLSRTLPNMARYDERIRVSRLLFLERDVKQCEVAPLQGNAAIERILDQVMETKSTSTLRILRSFHTLIRDGKVSRLKIAEHGSEEAIQLLTSRSPPFE